jgi:hypothetical protein
MVAGIQPTRVICKMRQMIPAMGRPIVKKVTHGRNKEISRRIVDNPLMYTLAVALFRK